MRSKVSLSDPEIRVPTFVAPWLTPVLLLVMSNLFMTFAWYGHLKFKEQPLWLVILASWGIAFIE